MTFILKWKRGTEPLVVDDDDLQVQYREVRRAIRDLGIGTLVEHAGWDKSHLRLGARRATEAGGRKISSGHGVIVASTAAGVKTALRRLRPEDQAELDGIDAEIVRLRGLIADCRRQREAAVARAWTKAHVVRLADTISRINTAGQ